ncbi:alpha/beta fold hydrolase [Christiangramia sabulilitoris]|uniref:Alpha/beta hydrolase n=1 Tax=Christiangramia sabulilitoris TaxID=2583991 RepID=A0A550I603_9FLAO|nr:alpha/beta hydrolase [Christiangramia sabulilitoris]TRO66409.1 alpha/beta hydrolase [Christiangramia sabulilitoris]
MSTPNNQEVLKRNNVSVKGKGNRPIIFAHGYGCDQNMWRYVFPAFLDDYKVILFDHVGAGNSEESYYNKEKYDSLQGYADDILEICHALDLKDVILVGHSVSAMIAVLAANSNPAIFSNIIMVGPSPCYINNNGYKGGFEQEDIEQLIEALESNYLGWASQMAPVIMGNEEKPELGEELTNSFCRTNPEIAKHFARVTFYGDNRDDLKKLKTPTLIIQCQQDVIAPLEVGEYVYNNTENSSFRIINATGHCPNLSAPEATIEAIKTYLEEAD